MKKDFGLSVSSLLCNKPRLFTHFEK